MVKKQRRIRREPPKVWINPDVVGVRRNAGSAGDGRDEADKSAEPPKEEPEAQRRIVARPTTQQDPRELERARLLERLRVAEGRAAISKLVDELKTGDFALPDDDQLIHLQLLEHPDEERVRGAIEALARILERETPTRGTVLDSRLRRLEEFADEAATRDDAARLRRLVKGLD